MAVEVLDIGAAEMAVSETSSSACHFKFLCLLTAESQLHMVSKAERMAREARTFGYVKIP
jgi:hypothetical protein